MQWAVYSAGKEHCILRVCVMAARGLAEAVCCSPSATAPATPEAEAGRRSPDTRALGHISSGHAVTPQLVTPQLVTPQLVTPQLVTPQLVTPQLVTPQLVTPQLGTMSRLRWSDDPGGSEGEGWRGTRPRYSREAREGASRWQEASSSSSSYSASCSSSWRHAQARPRQQWRQQEAAESPRHELYLDHGAARHYG